MVNYNLERCLEDPLSSILATKYQSFEVILVDNASENGSRKLIETFNDQRLKKILLTKNIGLYAAGNLGAGKTKSEYIVFLDADVKVTSMWLRGLVNHMESNPEVGAAESTIISHIPYARSSRERVKLFPLGAAFIVRASVWRQLGGFDADYFVGYGDQDLGWRTWLLGYKVVRVPHSLVYHVGGLLSKKTAIRALMRYHDFKNRISSLVKNLEGLTFLCEMPRMVLSIATYAFDDLKDGRIASLLGVFWVLKNLRKLIEKRNRVQRLRRIRDRDIEPLWNPSVRGSLRQNRLTLW